MFLVSNLGDILGHYVMPLNNNTIISSPVLGFLGTGALLGPSGFSVIKDLSELDTLGELGISFLLFEQGLELSLDRLKALSKYAFGLGTLQVRGVRLRRLGRCCCCCCCCCC